MQNIILTGVLLFSVLVILHPTTTSEGLRFCVFACFMRRYLLFFMVNHVRIM